jgi:hypothetical protein
MSLISPLNSNDRSIPLRAESQKILSWLPELASVFVAHFYLQDTVDLLFGRVRVYRLQNQIQIHYYLLTDFYGSLDLKVGGT